LRFSLHRPSTSSRRNRRAALLALSSLAAMAVPAVAQAGDFVDGDVFTGTGSGTYTVYSDSGVLKEVIDTETGSAETTGCAFDASGNFYGTGFGAAKVTKLAAAHPHGVLQQIDAAAQGGSGTESIVFAANGDFYVGNADGNSDVQKYDSAGNHLQNFDVDTSADRGSDFVDLAADQKTLFYTGEGPAIHRYDVSGAGAQLSDFATPGSQNFALRLLPPGDGTGGLLVASRTDIKRLDGSGNVVQTYDAPGQDFWFALNLDPNGTSFWSGNIATSDFYRFNLDTGAVEVGPVNTGSQLSGLCVKGEQTAGVPPAPPPSPSQPAPSACASDERSPSLRIVSNQRKRLYRAGEKASVRITASDANGLSRDPSAKSKRISTKVPGRRRFTATAVDRCGNRATKSFAYRIAGPPRVGISGVSPLGCSSADFTTAVRIRTSLATRRVLVFLDGRRIASSRRGAFRVRVPARRLSGGRHRLTVVARDIAGNRSRESVSFSRCRRVTPTLTG